MPLRRRYGCMECQTGWGSGWALYRAHCATHAEARLSGEPYWYRPVRWLRHRRCRWRQICPACLHDM